MNSNIIKIIDKNEALIAVKFIKLSGASLVLFFDLEKFFIKIEFESMFNKFVRATSAKNVKYNPQPIKLNTDMYMGILTNVVASTPICPVISYKKNGLRCNKFIPDCD